jgi:hypothetical protein
MGKDTVVLAITSKLFVWFSHKFRMKNIQKKGAHVCSFFYRKIRSELKPSRF